MITRVEQIAEYVKAERWPRRDIGCLKNALEILRLTSNELLSAELNRSPRWLNDLVCFAPQYEGDARRLAEAGARWRDLFNEQTATELPKVSNDLGVTEAPTTEAVAAERLARGRGRPKGAKNKPKQPKAAPLPIHKLTDKDALMPAVQDLLWTKGGLLMSDLMEHINCREEHRKQAMAIIHDAAEKGVIERRCSGYTKQGREVQRFYAIGKRKGYYYKGRLVSVRALARVAGMSFDGMRKRLDRMSVTDALQK